MSHPAEFADAGRTLVLRDRVTIADAQLLRAECLRASLAAGDVTVDATALQLLDTSAAQVLVALQRALAARGHALAWSALADAPRRHLARGGLLPLLNIVSA